MSIVTFVIIHFVCYEMMWFTFVCSYTHDIEAVSCDEMFVDLVEIVRDTGVSPLEFAEVLRNDILERTGCTSSAGIGNACHYDKIMHRY